MNPTVCVIGLGYIGLPTATVIASNEIYVNGMDLDERKVDLINQGLAPFEEPELSQLVHKSVTENFLKSSTKIIESDVYIIAVPTNISDGDTYEANMDPVFTVVRSLASFLKSGDILILESTSPIGTMDRISIILSELRSDLNFPSQETPNSYDSDVSLIYSPETAMPGSTIYELIHNNRIVGGINAISTEKGKEFYELFSNGIIQTTDSKTAEMVKLVQNSFRDVNIAFANEVSIISDKLGIDVWEMLDIANLHPRVNIMQPGCGVGGHCIPIDPWFLINSSNQNATLMKSARKVNSYKPIWVLEKINRRLRDIYENRDTSEKLGSVTLTVLGLTYKPDVDDIRESPAIEICKALLSQGNVYLSVIEPNLQRLPEDLIDLGCVKSELSSVTDSDLVVQLVAHKEFNDIKNIVVNNRFINFCSS